MLSPILDRLIVRRVKKDEKTITTDAGQTITIEIPEAYRQNSRYGIVVGVGQGVVLGQKWIPLTEFVNVGDLVYFGEYNAEPFEDKEPDLVLIRIQDVRGVEKHGS